MPNRKRDAYACTISIIGSPKNLRERLKANRCAMSQGIATYTEGGSRWVHPKPPRAPNPEAICRRLESLFDLGSLV